MKKINKREKLLKNSKGEYNYHFNWIGGGFNDVWAKNITDFKKVIKNQFPESYSKVGYDTVYKATATQAKEMDKWGWMMFN